MMLRGWLATAGVAGVLVAAAAAGTPERAMAVPAEHRTLVDAARQVLAARAIALVEGATPATDTPLAAGNVARAPSFAAAETAALRALFAKRDKLRAAGESYLAAETDVVYAGTRQPDDRLELTVTERTTLYRKQTRGDEPDRAAYEATRTFSFTRDGGRWVLLAQTLSGDGPVPLTEPDPGSGGGGSGGGDSLTPIGGVARVA